MGLFELTALELGKQIKEKKVSVKDAGRHPFPEYVRVKKRFMPS
ncbi:MAG: hypothetical protein ACLUOI_27525 [Eisenbergiella sp.]